MKKPDLDRWPPLISIAVLVACSGLLWAEYNNPGDLVGGDALGRVVQARGTLQRKAANAMIFQDTRARGRLRSGDTLRTSHSSRAVIELNSGIKITLGEFSMVQLSSSQNRLDLNLGRGSIRVGSPGQALRIRSDANDVELKDGELNLQRRPGSRLRIEVRKGEAELTADGRKHVLKENQLAEIQGKDVGIRGMALLPRSPGDGTVLFTSSPREKVAFTWKNQKPNSPPAILETARDADFKEMIRIVRVRGDSGILNLKPGAYYWRLRAGKETSETRFLLIRSLTAPAPVKPAEAGLFRRVAGPPRVDFVWVPGTTPADYTLEIAKSADFSKLLHSLKCGTTSLSLNLEPGSYFWRVRARLRDAAGSPAAVVSPTRSFRVRSEKSYKRPVLLAPESGARVSAGTARSAGILFSWRGPSEIIRWEWSLAADAAFTSGVQTAGAKQAYALLKGPLEAGISYWRVRGFDAKGRATPYSKPVRFRVIDADAIAVLSPSPGKLISTPRIIFRWRSGGTGSAYRFTLSRDEKQDDVVVSRLQYGQGLVLETPARGLYFWRVDIVRNGRVTARGPLRRFSIAPPPEAPNMIFPGPNITVDMSYREKLDFRWRGKATRYRLRLYQFKRGKRIRVLNILTGRTSYALTDLSRLDIGRFAWSVSAVAGNGRESPEKLFRFRVELKNRPKIPKIKSSGAEVK